MIRRIIYYEVHDNYSEDGRAAWGEKVIARFSTENTAKIFAKGRGNYGQDANIRKVNVTIFDQISEMKLKKWFS